MTWLQSLAAEFAITMGNREVWLSIGLALLLSAGCWVVGTWVARTVGLLDREAPAGETLAVGLASGLMVVAAWWAAIWSGGRSSFTPVAVGFALAIGLALAQRVRRGRPQPDVEAPPPDVAAGDEQRSANRNRSLLLTALAGAVFVVAVALLYGSTMAPSPRAGVQPVEFNDEAFYAVLGRDLATTGTETTLSASGFSDLPGTPTQTWYHWGEIWLASAVITLFGAAPMAARYFIVLPVVLLATAALSGTVVCRLTRRPTYPVYLFGFLACLFLAPVPLIPGPFFSSWAVGMIFGITLYGLGAVAALLAVYAFAVLVGRRPRWAASSYLGSAIAFMLPAHLAVAVLAAIGIGSVWAIRIGYSLAAARHFPTVSVFWRHTYLAAGIAIVITVLFAALTGHSQGASGATLVSPFNSSWRESIAITIFGAGVLLAIPLAWLPARREMQIQADLYLGTTVLLVAGAIGWGARLGDFTMFYLFFSGIAVFAAPVAAIAVWTIWQRLRAARHFRWAAGLAFVCMIQLEWGVGASVFRMWQFGFHDYEPIAVNLLETIRELPPEAKLAYVCKPLEESGFGVPQLLSIDAHTGRRIVPMCFEAELLSTLIGAEPSEQVENLFFKFAPQRVLYPDAAARPSSATVTAFLKSHGIHFIFADARHPNSLVADAVPIAVSGDAQILRIP